MPKILLLILGFFLESAVKRLLIGAGLSLVSMTIIQTLFDQMLSKALSSTNAMDSWILGLLAIAKIHICLSIIIGACVARVAISSASLALNKAG